MTDELKIKAFPTEYRGRMYRSRLEARWAAFFDLLGWHAEYEPFDLGAWSPDFLITSEIGPPILVEVKPTQEFAPEIGAKMIRAHHESGASETHVLLLVGVAPVCAAQGSGLRIGWHLSADADGNRFQHSDARIYWRAVYGRPSLAPDILVNDPASQPDDAGTCLLDCYEVEIVQPRQFYGEHTMELWARATSAVQWRPGR